MTGRIAPHEGRELAMVREGIKPLAVIEERKQPRAYREAVQLRWQGGTGLYIVTRIDSTSGPEAIVTRDPDLIREYREALAMPESAAKHWRMGELFGYSADDIRAFIGARPDCNCSKCTSAREAA